MHALYGLLCLFTSLFNARFIYDPAGVGAFAAPLAATHFSEVYHWTWHFIISLGIALTNTLVLALVFRGRTQDGESCPYSCTRSNILLTHFIIRFWHRDTFLSFLSFCKRHAAECMAEAGQPPSEVSSERDSKYKQILGLKVVHALAIFTLVYVGTEVTLGGKSFSLRLHPFPETLPIGRVVLELGRGH